ASPSAMAIERCPRRSPATTPRRARLRAAGWAMGSPVWTTASHRPGMRHFLAHGPAWDNTDGFVVIGGRWTDARTDQHGTTVQRTVRQPHSNGDGSPAPT